MFNKFKNSIVGKIMAGYAAIILLAFITTLVSMYSAWQNRKIDQRVSEAYYPMVLMLKETELMASESYKLTNNWIYQPNLKEKDKLKSIHTTEVAAQKEKLTAITALFESSVAEETKAISKAFDVLLANEKKVMDVLYDDSTYSNDEAVDEAITAMDDKITPAFKNFNEVIAKSTAYLNQLLSEANAEKETSSRMLTYLYIANMVLFLVIGAYAAYFSITYITKPIAGLSDLITTLSKGKFVSVTLKKGRDEIGRMAEAIESMLVGLKDKVVFAENIGKGNYESNFEMLSEDDTMGEALIRMRDNLKQAADEDRKRNWSTEGLARFAETLRTRNDNLSELSDSIISNLVKYMNANQGALFLVNDENQQDTFLELVACYAYNRKKFLSKRVELGEGITGQCILERETIYISDIPGDYIKITSGLGEALPKNLLVVPLKLNDNIFGVLEIASFQTIEAYQVEFVEKLGESIASTISSVKVNSHTKKLLEETQVQAEQMRAQEEEMRQNMEELSATQEEMQRVMREVQTKEQFTTELLNVSTDMIATIDHDYRIVNFNKAFERAVGNEFKIAKGVDMLSLLPEAQRAERRRTYSRVLNGESITQNEHYIANGKEVHLTTNQVPLRDDSGVITGVAIFTKDVTDITVAKNEAEKIAALAQQQSEQLGAKFYNRQETEMSVAEEETVA